MRFAPSWLVAAALLAGCTGEDAAPVVPSPPNAANPPASSTPNSTNRPASSTPNSATPPASSTPNSASAPASSTPSSPSAPGSLVPTLPASPDGIEEIAALDRRIAIHRNDPEVAIGLLLERAWIRGRLEDYVEALRRSKAWVSRASAKRRAWQTRALVLARVHEFAAARQALARARRWVGDPSELDGLAATIDEAAGLARAAAYREAIARDYPSPTTLTQWAASLATAGRHDEALAVMQRVPALVHDNPPQLLAWILFQWGRIYELRAEPAAARQFFEAARARLPTLEATVHLAQAIAATQGDPSAVVAAALVDNRHPELLALAGKIRDARRAWRRYVAALPRAFAGDAARFYLGPGRDPARALALARIDHKNRRTLESRAVVVEAALAAGKRATACALARPLATGAPAQQLMAWRAFSSCRRTGEAAALAARLGIAPSAP
jgi:tetratricopeptide (TPR) repeat protein